MEGGLERTPNRRRRLSGSSRVADDDHFAGVDPEAPRNGVAGAGAQSVVEPIARSVDGEQPTELHRWLAMIAADLAPPAERPAARPLDLDDPLR